MVKNPFIVAGEIPDNCFCDRQKESEWLISSVTNGNNIVLISPRRMGKTSLVEHCYNKEAIRDTYYTFYIDILSTSSISEFVYLLSKRIYETLLPKGKKLINSFIGALKSLRGCLGYDAISGMPTFTISGGVIEDPILTLEEIFGYLANADKPCIVTIDEFQQICRYKEKNVEAVLRTYIQKMRNCNFIFAGSERHIMSNMFNDSSRPFYNSASMIDLRAIPEEVYTAFIVDKFKEYNKKISIDDATSIYRTLEGNTYYIQRLCNVCFTNTPKGKTCGATLIEDCTSQILEMNSSFYRERLSLIPANQKPLLYAIAKSGSVKSILSAAFIAENALGTSSMAQYAAKQLLANDVITKYDGTYKLTDKFMALWIRRNL